MELMLLESRSQDAVEGRIRPNLHPKLAMKEFQLILVSLRPLFLLVSAYFSLNAEAVDLCSVNQ